MWFTILTVVSVSWILSKLYSASSVRRYNTHFEKLIHFFKFALIYPVISLIIIRRRALKKKRRNASNFASNIHPRDEDWKNETPRIALGPNEMDSIQFFGLNKNGDFCFVSLTERKKCTEILLLIRHKGQLYTLPDHSKNVREKYQNETRAFIGKGLRFELKEPCRKWRVFINTTLRKGIRQNGQDESDLVHVKLNGWWASNTDEYDFTIDHCRAHLSKTLAGNSWTSIFGIFSKINLKSTNQWGRLIGQLKIGNDVSEISMHCLKSRIYSAFPWKALTKLNAHVAVLEDGTYLAIGAFDILDRLKNIGYGYMCTPDNRFQSISDTDLIYDQIDQWSDTVSLPFTCEKRHHLRTQTELIIPLSLNDNGKQSLRVCRVELDGKGGYGFNFISSSACADLDETDENEVHRDYKYTQEESSMLILPFSHRAAKCPDLTGGKGCNLARLCGIQTNFTVPTGFCVTTSAYDKHVSENPKLKALLDKLINYGKFSNEELQSICLQIENLMTEIELSGSLKSEIEQELNRSIGDQWMRMKFAVRSSAVGEDSSDLSTAGQLETYLQRQGLESICDAVKLCWASQFRIPAVQYRKQHGQPLTHPVAVVIQEMIDPDVSGVLFTNDPVDDDPLKIIINANLGLGEAVVSGSVTPDTITLNRSYYGDTVEWDSVDLADIRKQCCLDHDLAIKLGQIGIEIEHAFEKRPKDIEWAIKDGKIYLLQARDITSLETETEYDLMHEFDDAIRNEDDAYTTANVGEVMAEPQTPLSISIQSRAIDNAIQASMPSRQGVFPMCNVNLHVHCYRALFNIITTIYKEIGHMEDSRVPEICFMGHPLNEKEIKKTAVARYGTPTVIQHIRRLVDIVNKVFFIVPYIQEKETNRYGNYKLGIDLNADAKTMHTEIGKRIQDLTKVWFFHLLNSASSSFGYNFVAALILPRSPREELTADHFSDIATLFSSCQNVVSADVPAALKELALAICHAGEASTFRNMTPEEAVLWLNSSDSGVAGLKFQDFMDKHGHRSIAEIDIGSVSWKSDPRPLIKTLQGMLPDEKSLWTKKDELTVDEAIKKLRNPVNVIKRILLKFFVPLARTGVVRREHSKNLGIKVTDIIRQGYRQLGSKLCEQGYLPDKELIFYMSHTEINDLIENRPARLVSKAVRRRKLMTILKTFQYPEMIIGQPKPIERANRSGQSGSSIVIKGTPVSQGIAEGKVRVAKRLDDAKDTQPGEILIATSTDIGWSPYFPMLSGVVTELGGLLSHGAVVAREYGLPCIVNAQNATDLFSTGDMARLDASKGILEKL